MKAQVWNRVRERLSGLVDVSVGMQVVGSVEGDKAMKGWVFIGFIHHHAGESRSRIVATGRHTGWLGNKGVGAKTKYASSARGGGFGGVCGKQAMSNVGDGE